MESKNIKIKKMKFMLNLKTSSLVLFFLFIITMISHILFNVGLRHDGAMKLADIIFLIDDFYILKYCRYIFQIFSQLPALLFIKFSGSNSLTLLTKIHSFGYIWIHIISLLGCYYILPSNKKNLLFFPLFAFFVGPHTAIGAVSVSVALSVFSYVWFIAYLIYYSDLSKKTHQILFFLAPLPLLLSHEMMSYTSWIFIFLYLVKLKSYPPPTINNFLIKFLILFFIITSFISTYFFLFPCNESSRDYFLKILQVPKPLIHPDNFLIFYSLNFILICFSFLLKNKKGLNEFLQSLLLPPLFYGFLLVLVFYSINNFYISVENRYYVSLILPFVLLIWLLFEQNKLQLKKSFLLIFLLFTIYCVFFNVRNNYRFYQHQLAVVKQLQNYKGILSYDKIKSIDETNFSVELENNKDLILFYEKAVKEFYNIDFRPFYASLLYPRTNKIEVLLLSKKVLKWCLESYGFFKKNISFKEHKKECLEGEYNLGFDETAIPDDIQTRFFDFSPLRKYIKSHEK